METLLCVGLLALAAWGGYRAGWKAHEGHLRDRRKADARKWEELAAIRDMDDSALALFDAATGFDAVGRKRSMPQDEREQLCSPTTRQRAALAAEHFAALGELRAAEKG